VFYRLTMPKLIINGVGDEFQQPDDNHYWWNEMPEPKYSLMMPNTDHRYILSVQYFVKRIT
jgi:PhoPQ-activated pathogenicity-related protein